MNDKIRRLNARQESIPERLEIRVQKPGAPWSDIELPECSIPGMISQKERQYY